MRRKLSTLLDEGLYDRTRHEALRQGRQMADVVCDALAAYLDSKPVALEAKGVVTESWGTFALPAWQVHELLSEEEELLDA
jgi:hypothetical protein